jgi:small-conductance mechanosensitive channel|tara:strand:- start:1838 stop:2359 length:522 start_codon:yes stop_codon:yes gene_type:complete
VDWLEHIKIPLSIALLSMAVIYVFVKSLIKRVVRKIGQEKRIALRRVQYVQFILTIFWTIITLAILGVITGFSYKDVGLIFTSIFAVLGVALFAQWSILSNVTASVIVFFFFPYHVGDHVKIIDGDDTIEGVILEITLFHVILKFEETHITYPNSLVFQKAVVITKDKGAKVL